MKSCTYLQSALFIAPDDVRTCCQRFFVRGQLKGDVSLNISPESGALTYEAVVDAKKKLVTGINDGTDDRCDGCPHLQDADWDPIDQESIDLISFEHHSICNMKCTYCSDTYYGGVRPQFDIMQFVDSVERVSPDLHIAWGGGEPTALKEFDKVFSSAQERFHPKTQRVFTNSLKFSPTIKQALDARKISITTSIDAGTPGTFEKIRRSVGFTKVLKHLSEYSTTSPDLVTIKYIFTKENHSPEELESFVREMERHDLLQCSFLLSTDYKIEKDIFKCLNNIMYLYFLLQDRNVGALSLDDHIFARLKKVGFSTLKEAEFGNGNRQDIKAKIQQYLDRFAGSDVILWGTGEFARRLLKNTSFRQKFNVVEVVDPTRDRHGRDFGGYEVYPVTNVTKSDMNIVIGSVNFYGEVFNELKRMNVDKSRVVPPFLVY